MKHTRGFLEKKFDQLYAQADQAMLQANPCQVKAGACLSMREYPENHVNEPFCCTGCKHLGPTGCTVQSLHCRLWTCPPIDNENISRKWGKRQLTPFFQELRRIKKEAQKYHFLIWRGTREESIARALKEQG
jgi:hypothetical protein